MLFMYIYVNGKVQKIDLLRELRTKLQAGDVNVTFKHKQCGQLDATLLLLRTPSRECLPQAARRSAYFSLSNDDDFQYEKHFC